MNTPSNAGKEHNPDGLPEMEGFRFLCIGEEFRPGDEYWDRGAQRWLDSWNHKLSDHPTLGETDFTYRRRRTAPPTQSQEGETPETDAEWFGEQIDKDGNPKENWRSVAFEMRDHSRRLESRLTAVQRENDRLRSEVAGLAKYGSEFMRLHLAQGILMAEYKSASFLNAEDEHELAKRISEMSCQLQDAEDAFNAARAATEEGKRG